MIKLVLCIEALLTLHRAFYIIIYLVLHANISFSPGNIRKFFPANRFKINK